ncbi:MAG: response regulator [Nitrospinae bacterium]|nr:response regulator [Nitrospinota bacterium]
MSPDLLTKKVLVVDHSKVICKIIQNFLSQSGFEQANIFKAETKNQAEMMLGLESFDLITSGVHLKDGSGIDFLKELRGNGDDKHREVPFLFISAENKESYLKEIEALNSNGFLNKPFSQQQLDEHARKALNCFEDSSETASPPCSEAGGESEIIEVPEKIIEHFTKSTIEAMEQYMADASLTELKDDWKLNGYFSSWVDLMDSEKRVQLNLIINFPKKVACDIYEGIFGDVDLEQVSGVVQELVNILGGIVKPKIADYTTEIMQLAYWKDEVPAASGSFNFDLGLPESKMGEDHELDIELEGSPKFVLPFECKEEIFYLVVQFQKF